MNNIFFDLIVKLLQYNTFSGNEHIMRKFIKKTLNKCGFQVNIDDIGNIYAVRGKATKYPLLNAHMDIVDVVNIPIDNKTDYDKHCEYCACYDICLEQLQTNTHNGNENKAITDIITNGYTYAKTCKSYSNIDEYGNSNILYGGYGYNSYTTNEDADEYLQKHHEIYYDEKTSRITNNNLRAIGGDDKCGIAIILQLARETSMPMKILLTVQEEIGCVGVKHFIANNAEWFNDVMYSLTIDRRGGDELLIESLGGINGSRKFMGLLANIGIQVGVDVKIESGTVADVIYIRDYVPECCNMSAGYYSAHTTSEYVQYDEMELIKDWVRDILMQVKESDIYDSTNRQIPAYKQVSLYRRTNEVQESKCIGWFDGIASRFRY